MVPQDRSKMKEIILQNYLHAAASGQDALANFCQVSRRMSAIATPILYHCLSDGCGTKWQTTLFLNVISSKPSLAARVRYFAPVLYGALSSLNFHYDPLRIPRDRGIVYESFGISGTIDPFLVGLAWAAQNVQEIVINPQDLRLKDDDPHWDYLPDRGFPSLRTLDLRWNRGFFDPPMTTLSSYPIARLLQAAPGLQTLKFSYIFFVEDGMPILENLKSIQITESVLGEEQFEFLIKKLPVIEEFEYHPGWQISSPRRVIDISLSPHRLFCYLARCGKTLKRINVDQSWRTETDRRQGLGHSEDDVIPCLLEHFPVLEHLTVNTGDIYPVRHRNREDGDNFDDEVGELDKMKRLVKLHRNESGERLLGLVPPTLKSLAVLGLAPFSECPRLSNSKALGKSGKSLEAVKFGDVGNVDIFNLIDNAQEEIMKHFKEAGVECEVMAVKNEELCWNSMLGSNEEQGSDEGDDETADI